MSVYLWASLSPSLSLLLYFTDSCLLSLSVLYRSVCLSVSTGLWLMSPDIPNHSEFRVNLVANLSHYSSRHSIYLHLIPTVPYSTPFLLVLVVQYSTVLPTIQDTCYLLPYLLPNTYYVVPPHGSTCATSTCYTHCLLPTTYSITYYCLLLLLMPTAYCLLPLYCCLPPTVVLVPLPPTSTCSTAYRLQPTAYNTAYTAYCLLPPHPYYLLPTTYYLLPTTHYPLPTTYYLLPTTYTTCYYLQYYLLYLLPTTYYLLPTTYYLLPTTY